MGDVDLNDIDFNKLQFIGNKERLITLWNLIWNHKL
jgi:hypothetical protein